MQYYKNFTYKLANFPKNEWKIYSDELMQLYNFYNNPVNKEFLTFYTLSLSNAHRDSLINFQNICPILYKRMVDLQLDSVALFLSFIVIPPGKERYGPQHIDTRGIKINNEDFSMALNFPELNCEKSYNVWYHMKNRIIDHKAVKPIRDESFLDEGLVTAKWSEFYKQDHDAVEVSRFEVVRPYWINTSIPHAIEVHHEKLRIAATFRFPFTWAKTIQQSAQFEKFFITDEDTSNW